MLSEAMITVYEQRERFGAEVRTFRNKAELSLRELGAVTGIHHAQLCDIERGDKPAGSDVAVRLADAFNLTGDERDLFLINAAGTRKRDKLVGYARMLPPQIVNFLARALNNSGVALEEINSAEFRRTTAQGEDGKCPDELVLGLKGGKHLVCGLVMTAEG